MKLQHTCHFCKIVFNPESPYHNGASLSKPQNIYDVCADCALTAARQIKNPDELGVLKQLSLNTGISIAECYSHTKKVEENKNATVILRYTEGLC